MQAAQKTRAWPKQFARTAYLHNPRMCERKKLLPHLRTCKRAHKVKIGVAGKTRGPISHAPSGSAGQRPGVAYCQRALHVRRTCTFGQVAGVAGAICMATPAGVHGAALRPRTHAVGKPGKSSLGKTAQAASRKPSTSNMSNRPDCLPARKRAARKLPCA